MRSAGLSRPDEESKKRWRRMRSRDLAQEERRRKRKRSSKIRLRLVESRRVGAGSKPSVSDGRAASSDGSEVLELPVLPLRGTVVFPLTVVPLAAAQPRSLRLIDEVMSGDRTVALVMQKDAELEGAGPDDIYDVGTISTIHQMMRVPDGTVRLAVQGNERMRVLEFLQRGAVPGRSRATRAGNCRGIGRSRCIDAKHARAVPTARLAGRAHAG